MAIKTTSEAREPKDVAIGLLMQSLETVNELREAIERGWFDNLKQHPHRLKSVAGNLTYVVELLSGKHSVGETTPPDLPAADRPKSATPQSGGDRKKSADTTPGVGR